MELQKDPKHLENVFSTYKFPALITHVYYNASLLCQLYKYTPPSQGDNYYCDNYISLHN